MGSKKWTILLLGLSILIPISFVVLLVTILLFYTNTPQFDTSSSAGQTYQYQELNFQDKKTTYGFVTLGQDLTPEDFISYRNEESGNYVVISNFGGSQYACKGTCICGTKNNQRRTTSVLGRGMFLVVSAFSTALAMKVSEQAFLDKCLQETDEEECDEPLSIDPQECFRRVKEEDEEVRKTTVDYDCEGSCLKNPNLKGEVALKEQENWDCESVKTQASVFVEKDESLEESVLLGRAKQEFYKEFLRGYCQGATSDWYKEKMEDGSLKEKYMSFCIAGIPGSMEKSIERVKCNKVEERWKSMDWYEDFDSKTQLEE